MSKYQRGGSLVFLIRLVLFAPLLACVSCAGPRYQDTMAASTRSVPTSASGQEGVSLRLARAARDAGDASTAIELYRGLGRNPSTGSAVLLEVGDNLSAAGFYDEAIDVYGRVEGSSSRLSALLGLVRAHLALGEPEVALKLADQAKSLAPQDARAQINRGVVLDSLLRHAEAQDAYRSALLITPRSISARNNLAISLALTNQFDQAVAILEPMARSASGTPKLRENLAMIYGLSGDSARAAVLSRMDLDESATAGNMAFFALLRSTKP